MKGCPTGKREYPNVRSARTALSHCKQSRDERRKRARREERFYRCGQCKSFHLTSEPLDDRGKRLM